MSDVNKLNLWQKLKRLLTSKAPQEVIDSTNSVDEVESFENLDISTASLVKSKATESVALATKNSYTQMAAKKSSDSHKPDDKKQANNAKVPLTKPRTDSLKQTPIIDYLKHYFARKQWHYTHYKPRVSSPQQSHHLSLRMKSHKVDCGYLFRAQEAEALLAVYGILPFLIPESHQSAAILLITQINYDMIVGNLEMDVNDGEIRYKNAIDVEVVGLDDDIIEHLLQSVVAMTTVAHEVFSDLINTSDPSDDMPTLLGELRKQADARTFFLASKKMH